MDPVAPERACSGLSSRAVELAGRARFVEGERVIATDIPSVGAREFLFWCLGCRYRYRVVGDSMVPTLRAGAQVLVDRRAYRGSRPRCGDVVLLEHPFQPMVLIKRVSQVLEDGVMVVGDNPAASTDSRTLGRIRFEAVLGCVRSCFH